MFIFVLCCKNDTEGTVPIVSFLEDHFFNGENQDTFGTGILELADDLPETLLVKNGVLLR